MKKVLSSILLFMLAFSMFSCSDDDDNGKKTPGQTFQSDETVIVFFPYTVNLYKYLNKNISDIESAMLKTKDNPNVIVYINESKNKSCIYNIRRDGDVCVHDTLRVYQENDYTSAQGLANLFTEIKTLTPGTKSYSMIVGCHGMGWIYSDDYKDVQRMSPALYKDSYDADPVTRWMGVASAMIDMDKLAQGMEMASLHTRLMLFDVCYMGNIESVYELRNVSDYIIASSIEIMARGMEYEKIWEDIISSSEESLNNICNKFYAGYNSSDQPYAAIATLDCDKMENLAAVVKDINSACEFPEEMRDSLQMLDGFRPSLFYDLGRYVELQCQNEELLSRFDQAMDEVVIFKYNTDKYYTSLAQGAAGTHQIRYCSGVTTSAPSLNELKVKGWSRTQWYKATH